MCEGAFSARGTSTAAETGNQPAAGWWRHHLDLAPALPALVGSSTGIVIYMVEMGFPHPERLAEWHDWYMEHIKVLLTVPGFHASQRFEAVVDNPSPYLALHEIASAEMFQSEVYRNRGGPTSVGEWRSLQTNWHRNLLDGLDETPEVPPDAYLLLLRDARDVVLPAAIRVDWLRGVGLDGTVKECGLAVLPDPGALLDLAGRDERVRVFGPITEKIRASRPDAE